MVETTTTEVGAISDSTYARTFISVFLEHLREYGNDILFFSNNSGHYLTTVGKNFS